MRRFSFLHRDNLIVYEDVDGNIIVHDAVTKSESVLLSAKEAMKLPEQGGFFPDNSDPSMAIYHTDMLSFRSDETFIITHNKAISLCLNGSVDYAMGIPSWSTQRLYQFSLLQVADDLVSQVWVYDATGHRLLAAIPQDIIEKYQRMGWRLVVIGWG